MDHVEYYQSHCKIVEEGMDSIISYYENNDHEDKRSLLLCLDRYLDPYYKYNLPYANKIFNWLEEEFYKTRDITIKEEIFELIHNYSDIEVKGYEFDDKGNFVKTE